MLSVFELSQFSSEISRFLKQSNDDLNIPSIDSAVLKLSERYPLPHKKAIVESGIGRALRKLR